MILGLSFLIRKGELSSWIASSASKRSTFKIHVFWSVKLNKALLISDVSKESTAFLFNKRGTEQRTPVGSPNPWGRRRKPITLLHSTTTQKTRNLWWAVRSLSLSHHVPHAALCRCSQTSAGQTIRTRRTTRLAQWPLRATGSRRDSSHIWVTLYGLSNYRLCRGEPVTWISRGRA